MKKVETFHDEYIDNIEMLETELNGRLPSFSIRYTLMLVVSLCPD